MPLVSVNVVYIQEFHNHIVMVLLLASNRRNVCHGGLKQSVLFGIMVCGYRDWERSKPLLSVVSLSLWVKKSVILIYVEMACVSTSMRFCSLALVVKQIKIDQWRQALESVLVHDLCGALYSLNSLLIAVSELVQPYFIILLVSMTCICALMSLVSLPGMTILTW